MSSSMNDPAADIRSFLSVLMREYHVPGASVSVLYKGQEVICQGLGVTDFTTGAPVTERTRFCVGSITKGFTSALLAGLLPQCGFNWSSPIVKMVNDPSYGFSHPYLTENACLRDLLAHRMGIELGESDFGWLSNCFQRRNLLKIVKHLPVSAAGFRSTMMYNNYMYAVAGRVAELLAGDNQTWEELIRERFFQLLGMSDSSFITEEGPESHDMAKPHMLVEGKPVEISLDVHRCCQCVGPAASICTSAQDMAKWLRFLLDKGSLHGLPIIPQQQLRECWKPQMALPSGKPEWDGYVSKPQFPVTETRDTYGLGWHLGTYRGYKLVAHSGELMGFDSLVTLYPDLDLAIYTSFNGPGGEHAYLGNQLSHYFITDTLLGLEKWITAANVSQFPQPWLPRERYFIPRVSTGIIRGIAPTRSRSQYLGTYHHGFLGIITVTSDSVESLVLTHGKCEFRLHPNGEVDEFRLEGTGIYSFLHQLDLYSPTDWMMVRFCSLESDDVDALMVSLFESGPTFRKSHLIM